MNEAPANKPQINVQYAGKYYCWVLTCECKGQKSEFIAEDWNKG